MTDGSDVYSRRRQEDVENPIRKMTNSLSNGSVVVIKTVQVMRHGGPVGGYGRSLDQMAAPSRNHVVIKVQVNQVCELL